MDEIFGGLLRYIWNSCSVPIFREERLALLNFPRFAFNWASSANRDLVELETSAVLSCSISKLDSVAKTPFSSAITAVPLTVISSAARHGACLFVLFAGSCESCAVRRENPNVVPGETSALSNISLSSTYSSPRGSDYQGTPDMAPKKKGKKATSKPLRGYATTSVPSKNTAESAKNEEALDSTTTPELFKESKNPNVATIDRTIGSKELHELDPAELEKQLEESDLQLLLEKHGQKSKKDASRQISRLQTERRLLRPQSELLGVRSWLSPDLLQTIIDLYETNQSSPNGFEKLQTSMQLQEDDLCIKLWTLRQVLSQIGFSSEQCQEALCHAMKVVRQSQASDISADKDTIWGLEVCLEWLSFKYQSNEMPPYEAELAPGLAKKSLNRQQADFDRLYASSGRYIFRAVT